MAWLGEALSAGPPSGATPFGPRCVKDQIEEALFARRRDLFSSLSVAFFDTTSLYFEGQGGTSLGRRGKSKDHRPDLRQMVVGVVLDQEGQPVCSHLWPGNTADVKSLVPVARDLQQRFGVGRICVVADRGMISAETIAQLEALGWEYILGARMRNQREVRDEVVGKLTAVPQSFAVVHPEREQAKDPSPLAVKEVRVGAHRYVVCYNAEQARKDAHDRAAIVAGLRQALRAGDKSLIGNQGYRRYLKNPGHHFEIDEEALHREARYDGLWVLRTNTDLATVGVALRYKELWRVERLFRDTKSLVRTRPIYHKLDETIRGHVFCSFLALVVLRELDRCLEQAGVHAEWNDVLRDLKALQRMELQEGDKRMWIRSQVQGCCAQVFKAVGLALPPVLQLGDAPSPLRSEWDDNGRDRM
jgi:transposase